MLNDVTKLFNIYFFSFMYVYLNIIYLGLCLSKNSQTVRLVPYLSRKMRSDILMLSLLVLYPQHVNTYQLKSSAYGINLYVSDALITN
jgi:hypothetical protein